MISNTVLQGPLHFLGQLALLLHISRPAEGALDESGVRRQGMRANGSTADRLRLNLHGALHLLSPHGKAKCCSDPFYTAQA